MKHFIFVSMTLLTLASASTASAESDYCKDLFRKDPTQWWNECGGGGNPTSTPSPIMCTCCDYGRKPPIGGRCCAPNKCI